jgi:hypothetical protein
MTRAAIPASTRWFSLRRRLLALLLKKGKKN